MNATELRPTARARVYDLVTEAGIDTSPWADYAGPPAANPKYCYQWAFESGHATVLNVWHKDIQDVRGSLELAHNMRRLAANDAIALRRARAEEFDRAVQRAFVSGRPVRLIVCDGKMDNAGLATRASKRLLDPYPWWVRAYDHTTGKFLLVRGESPVVAEPDQLPEELPSKGSYWEGVGRQVIVNRYERNTAARRKCLEHHGDACAVCGIRFEDVYGLVAAGYMHIHHVKPISEIAEQYEVDPVEDLRPVCPNCHAVIHLHGECRSIDVVRTLLRDA
jgi:5-methylcytosine-specific restriction enzyme A